MIFGAAVVAPHLRRHGACRGETGGAEVVQLMARQDRCSQAAFELLTGAPEAGTSDVFPSLFVLKQSGFLPQIFTTPKFTVPRRYCC